MLLLPLGAAMPAFRGEPNVLDGRIFQGTSNYSAVNDDDLIKNVVRRVDAVILGSLDGPANVAKGSARPVYRVTVIECYKRVLKRGDKIWVVMGEGKSWGGINKTAAGTVTNVLARAFA
jgi:hypothetical protein